jgi:phosphopantothenoylcysteine decarboxylase/phosphopantothenate--cysteine ligase
MALALARAAYHRGAQVTLIHGPMAEPVPDFITQQAITTSEELGLALLAQAPHADLILMNAAVGDVRPRQTSPHKLAKAEIPLELPLAPVPDILSQLTAQKPTGQRIVGFAAQTGDILPPAWAKLRAKKVDALFVNPIDQVGSGFASPTNQGFLLLANGAEISIPQGPKLAVAHQIFDQLLPL